MSNLLQNEVINLIAKESGGTSDYTQLENLPKINSVELTGNKTSAQLGLQSAFTTSSFANSSTVTLANLNTAVASEAITSVTVAYPATIASDFISEVQFTTGTGTITFGVSTGTAMKGDDCDNGTFTPLASSAYSIIFAVNGTNKYAIVVKVV